ncbi:hypothetical protein Hypma_012860 [Hypsizygus marmoreus]|uniref:Uncharacterized protein n=1 Tax=Hypsizygus marmoreus TaxID=39966 RepID=A0A369JD94_HYPMA|nr:hypothetical protein Hypma_012860 [Hypsizygus marmoreus]
MVRALPLLFERFGGYCVEPCFTEAIVFNDGSLIPVDVVMYATGYHNIRDTIKETFGVVTVFPAILGYGEVRVTFGTRGFRLNNCPLVTRSWRSWQ